jgi:copper oxidase (laccase) domain-containing protein
VSQGDVSGLNVGLGAGDEPAAVAQNRARAVAAVAPGARLVTVYQVHSADCVVAGDWDNDHRPHADALVTDRPGVVLGIVTADCAPILLADAGGRGGRGPCRVEGRFGGVAEATVAAMVALGAGRADCRRHRALHRAIQL